MSDHFNWKHQHFVIRRNATLYVSLLHGWLLLIKTERKKNGGQVMFVAEAFY